MISKIKNLKRRWRKLSEHQKIRLIAPATMAIIFLPFSPMSSLWMVLITFVVRQEISLQRCTSYAYYRYGVIHEMVRNMDKTEKLYRNIHEADHAYLDLLDKYNHLKAAHNKLLRRRRKENNQ